MCGICGFVGNGSARDLEQMMQRLVHRGPDDFGSWRAAESAVWLGCRRLCVVDIPGGHQPMTTSDNQHVIVFNGEIYNHADIRADLQKRGHQFQTDHSDTEVILLGYREWGAEIVHRLNGMWAFAIYDRTQSILFCSRDRFGEKPFYFAKTNQGFAFASELTALTEHPDVSKNVSERALQKYFGYGYIPAPLSIYDDVSKLPAGHSLFFDLRSLEYRVEKYWDFLLEPSETVPRRPEEEWGEQLRQLLDQAVRRRLLADVPVGVFLSGGIDSSAVTSFAARHVEKGKLKTFAVGFEEETFDETKFSVRASEHVGTDHQVEVLSAERARELMDECLNRLDEPLADSSLLPTYLVSRFASKQVTVALGGDGGDELFAGYDPFRALNPAAIYHALVPRRIHPAIKALFNRLPVSSANIALDFKIKRALRGLDYESDLWLPTWMAPLDLGDLEELFSTRIDIHELYSEAIELWDTCPQSDPVDKTIQFYAKLYLQDDILTKVDRASMMHSLEVRAPFLDIELVNFVRRIPAKYKFRNGQTKYLLKKSLRGVLPNEILLRSKKGFGTPVGPWLRNGSIPVEPVPRFGLNEKLVAKKIAAHRRGETHEGMFLWGYYVLNKWAAANDAAARC